MRIPSGAASRPHRLTCLFCESGESLSLGQGFVRCDSCGMLLIGSTLEVLHDVVGLPDALGSRPCANAETPRCAICPTGCSTARRAAQRSCPSRWIDAVTTEYRAPSPLGPTRPRTTEERRSIRTPTNHPRGDPKMRESMFDVQVWKQHREEITREVRQNRLAKVLRNSRKRHGSGRTSSPAWELKRIAGRFLKPLSVSRKVGWERRERRVREKTAWLADTELVPDGGPEGDIGAAYPRETEAPEYTPPTDERS
jgi:hypothetical protein